MVCGKCGGSVRGYIDASNTRPLCKCKPDTETIMNVIRHLETENDRLKNLLRDMEEYTEHDCTCPMSQWRMGEPTDEPGYDGYKTLFGYGKNEKWYGRNEYPPCNCGLREIIDQFKEAIGEK